MSSGNFDLTTYYAKRIMGDAAADNSEYALIQTGSNITSSMWILNQTSHGTDIPYGIKYIYDSTNGDSIAFIGGTSDSNGTKASINLKTGNITGTWNDKTVNDFATANHTHSISLAKNTTNSNPDITLDYSTKYTLTAGGSTYIFKTPSSSHTHSLSIETESSAASSVTLTYGGKYKLTAGGSTYVFTMPDSDNTNTTYAFASGTANGTFKYAVDGGNYQDVAITGLASAAYTESSAYASSDHTHTLSLATNSGTQNVVTLAANTTYQLTAGGNSILLKTPPDNNTTYSTFLASGTNHAGGLVPDPGATEGTVKYLREDATWHQITPAEIGAVTLSTPTHSGQLMHFKGRVGTHNTDDSAYDDHVLILNITTTGLHLWDASANDGAGASVWSFQTIVRNALGIDTSSGSTTTWLNKKGGWSTPTAAQVGAAPDTTVSCTTANVKSALGTVATTAKKFLKDTGSWVQVDWGDLTGKPSTFAPSAHNHASLVNRTTYTKGTNPSEESQWYTLATVLETGTGVNTANRLAWLGGYITTAGSNVYEIVVYNYAVGGTSTNSFQIGIKQNGDCYYIIKDPAAFRTALGLGNVSTRDVYSLSAQGDCDWNTTETRTKIPDIQFLAYWNGAYTGTSSNLSILGTITTGTWNATKINPNKGGTGIESYAKGDILYAGAAIANTATTALSKLTIGSSGQVLQTTSSGIPGWITATNANTASTIVKRDSSGNFSAGTITASLSGNATSSTSAKYLMNRGASTVTIADDTWAHGHTPSSHTNRETVWHQRWKQSGITYTPSGGSATTNTDSGDMVLWLSSHNTTNTLQLNMAIDGDFKTIGAVVASNWFRSIGNSGWYNATYGGGWYMYESDTTNHTGAYVKLYGNKQVVIGSNHTTSATNLSSQLIVSAVGYSSAIASTNVTDPVGIELWRGTNASWQIVNISGHLHFKCNWTNDTKQQTYTQDCVDIVYDTGNATFSGSLTAKGLITSIKNGYTLTIGAQNSNWIHIYNNKSNDSSVHIPFIMNDSLACSGAITDGDTADTHRSLGTTAYPWHRIILGGPVDNDMSASSTSPRITFQQGTTDTQPVHIIYTDFDNYRSPAGLKIIGGGTSSSPGYPAWLEVEGNIYTSGDGIYFKNSSAEKRMIRFIGTDTATGHGIAIGGQGLAAIGAGESIDSLISDTTINDGSALNGGTEHLYLTSDNNIYFYAGGNTWSSKKKLCIGQSGTFYVYDGNIMVGETSKTDEHSVRVQSNSGVMYMYSSGDTNGGNGNRGIYLQAHGEGSAKNILVVNKDNAATFYGTFSGNASTATKFSSTRTITLTGSVTGSATTDGSSGWSITTTTNHTHSYAGSSSAGGSATTADKVIHTATGVSYIQGARGDNAAVYAKKATGRVWYPAVCLQTSEGGSWQIGNYDTEVLRFVYATSTNISNQTNETSSIYMTAGDSGRVATSGNVGTGDSDGQIKIAGTNVSVKGLGTAAYTASTAYATSGHTHGWADLTDNAGSLSAGTTNCTSGTEILTSYASDDGFANTTKPGKVYRRSASSIVNATLVKAALGTDGSTTTQCLTKKGTWATFGTSNLALGTTSTTALKGDTVVTHVSIGANVTTNANYPVVFATSTTDTTAAKTEALKRSGAKFYFNPSTGLLTATKVANAIWNDYAECRESDLLPPGTCVQENDNGHLTVADDRLIPGASVISDTFGTIMGETATAKTPIAVAGRVLVYTYLPREMYHAGMAVCSAPGGTVDIMSRAEIQKYPDAIVGIVSEIPNYDEWGTGRIKVDNRIWIKVR